MSLAEVRALQAAFDRGQAPARAVPIAGTPRLAAALEELLAVVTDPTDADRIRHDYPGFDVATFDAWRVDEQLIVVRVFGRMYVTLDLTALRPPDQA